MFLFVFFFLQAEDGIRDAQESRGLGDVYKRQGQGRAGGTGTDDVGVEPQFHGLGLELGAADVGLDHGDHVALVDVQDAVLSLIHI